MSTASEPMTANCAEHPTTPRPNADITGIGISLAWVITAGLALTLVIVNYFVAYRPDFDPFTLQDLSQRPDRGPQVKPNPIDCLFLNRRLRRAAVQVPAETQARRNRISEALTLCMLTMSDFQLITGLSVLISAYSQLDSGLSTRHWDRVIDLAWFSSITHLCCLTFLRDYFIQNKRAQIWRIPGMVLLAILLGVALIPSSRYSIQDYWYWSDGQTYKADLDYAICFFKPSMQGVRRIYFIEYKTQIGNKKQDAMISAIILIFGMTNRIWRLYETSTQIYIYVRGWFSRHVKKFLRLVFKRTQSKSPLVVAFIYRPILASYLACHSLLDILLSKAFEIWWLTIGFFWGLTNLFRGAEADDHVWTFGQVIALLMLVSPVISLVETYCTTVYRSKPECPNDVQIRTTESVTAVSAPAENHLDAHALLVRGDPDFDLYNAFGTFVIAVCVMMAFITGVGLLFLVAKGFLDHEFEALQTLWANGRLSVLMLVNFTLCILCSLTIDENTPTTRAGRIAVKTAGFVCFGCMTTLAFLTWLLRGFYLIYDWTCPTVGIGMYLALVTLELALKKRKKRQQSHGSPLLVASGIHDTVPLATMTTVPPSAPQPSATTDDATVSNGVSLRLSPIHTEFALNPLQRQDTEADLGIRLPRM